MSLTPGEAAESLADARAVTRNTRRALFAAGGSELLMLWGAVWIACFVACHLAPQHAHWHWSIGNLVGFAGMAIIYWCFRGQPTRSDDTACLGLRIGGFWVAFSVYLSIWMCIAQPENGIQLNALLCTMIMFAFIVLGIWMDAPLLIGLGIFITAATMAAFFCLPLEWYNVWMAVFGGGSMFLSGIYTFIRWRA